ncbi:Sulfate-transporting ATPase [Marinithermus hydrothermalis DSM 14884]|uniref:Sulfate-transporting ATPase n=2 Tax=Marinithermus TaxID=186191 RepID=F2NQI0_MARHT|nr:Sulfate-transporting ATPase [Marinithermus hydrothermalis DSM 14884]
MDMIQVDGLSKRYGGKYVVDQLHFEVPQGEVFGLLGPNGAGKTTTLRMLATLIRPTAGTARVGGVDIRQRPLEVRRNLGIVNGGMGLYERMTGEEILRFFARFYGIEGPEFKRRLAWVDDLLEMGDLLKKQVREMSSGMQQKLIIARAVLHEPPVLLLDEATAGLDVFARRALLDFVAHYRTMGHTIIYSTHVMAEAEEVCDRVGFLHQGKLLFIGRIEEALQRYNTPNLERAFIRAVRGAA